MSSCHLASLALQVNSTGLNRQHSETSNEVVQYPLLVLLHPPSLLTAIGRLVATFHGDESVQEARLGGPLWISLCSSPLSPSSLDCRLLDVLWTDRSDERRV
jgi:hypothetical protein